MNGRMPILSSYIVLVILVVGDLITSQESASISIISDSNPCIIQTFLPCDETNQRSIIYSKAESEKCSDSTSNDISGDKSLNSQLIIPPMVKNVPCEVRCDKGWRYIYDKEGKCEICPANTYSTGGNLVIEGSHKQWSQDFLTKKGLVSNCYVATFGSKLKYAANENCEPFKVESDGSMLVSGSTEKQSVKYIAELIYGVNLRHKGEIKFKYKKDTVNELFETSGEFLFYVDYDLKIEERDVGGPWKTFSVELEPGEHNFIWIYDFWRDWYTSKVSDMKLKIESLEISGIEDASFECKKCVNSVAPEGSSECFHCEANTYFLEDKCEKCPSGKFSFPNSIDESSCMTRPSCDENDFSVINETDCLDGSRKYTYHMTEPVYCDLKNSQSIKLTSSEEKCREPNEINECVEGKYAPKVLVLDRFYSADVVDGFNNTCISSTKTMCNVLKGWQFKKDKIISGKYMPGNTEVDLSLTRSIDVIDPLFGVVEFEVEVGKMDESEILEIFSNNTLLDQIKGESNFSENKKAFKYTIEEGTHVMKWRFYRSKLGENSTSNAVSLRNIVITGSNQGSRSECLPCPKGSVRSKKEDKCVICGGGLTFNPSSTTCESCPKGQYLNEDKVCTNCASFTSAIEDSSNAGHNLDNSCILDDIIEMSEERIRYNFYPLRKKIERECSIIERGHYAHTLCYNGKYIGIKDKNNKVKNKAHDFYFLSVFQPDYIKISDFSYKKDSNRKSKGHIFALFQKETIKMDIADSSYIQGSSDIRYENEKLMKNIGSAIKKVSIVKDGVAVSEKYGLIKNGIIVEYEEGDECLEDPAKRYKSYVYLECNRESGAKYPSLEAKLDKGCTLLFKWSTDFACKNCLVSEVNTVRTPCKDSRQIKMYLENYNCLIFKINNNTEYRGYGKVEDNKSLLIDIMNDPIINEYRKVEYNKRLLESNTLGSDNKNNFNISTPDSYVDVFSEVVECNILRGLNQNTMIILILIPVVYILMLLLFICLYCRYKKVRNDYERLNNRDPNQSRMEEATNSNNDRQLGL